MIAVAFDFAGGRIDVAGTFLVGFLLLTMACVVVPLFFNQSADPSLYVDEHWGNGAIDDDEWGLDVAAARRSTQVRLRALAVASRRDPD